MRDYAKKTYCSQKASLWPVVTLIIAAYLFAELDWDRIFGLASW